MKVDENNYGKYMDCAEFIKVLDGFGVEDELNEQRGR
jgi:hypothetical protein